VERIEGSKRKRKREERTKVTPRVSTYLKYILSKTNAEKGVKKGEKGRKELRFV